MDGPRRSRVLLPKPARRSPDSSGPAAVAISTVAKKVAKALAACEGCRRRKCRCDGARPVCGQCISTNLECRYKVPAGMSRRDADKHEAQQVSKANQDLRIVLDLLRRTTETVSADLLRRIKEAPTLDLAVGLIADASVLLPDDGRVEPNPSPTRMFAETTSLSPQSGSAKSDTSGHFDGTTLPITAWTDVSKDNDFMNYLLSLFWTWDNVVSQVIHQGLFLQSLRLGPQGNVRPSYCSPFLVNALLAVSFLYLKQLYVSRGLDDLDGFGRLCANASLATIHVGSEPPSISMLQGLALLWVFEYNLGDEDQATALLDHFYRVYLELRLYEAQIPVSPTTTAPEHVEVQGVSSILWGLYCMDSKISLMFSRPMVVKKPAVVRDFPTTGPSELSNVNLEDQPWFPYPNPTPKQLSFHREALEADCNLAEIIEASLQSINEDRSSGSMVSHLKRTQAFYDELVAWKSNLPQRLLMNEGHHPQITFLHTTYDMAAIKLLQLTARRSILGLDDQDVSAAVSSHAQSLVSSLWVYRAAHGLRHDYWLAQACFAAAAALLLLDGGGRAGGGGRSGSSGGAVRMHAFERALQTLGGMARYMASADRLLLALGGLLARAQARPSGPVLSVMAGAVARVGRVSVVGAAVLPPRKRRRRSGSRGEGEGEGEGAGGLEMRDVTFNAAVLSVRE